MAASAPLRSDGECGLSPVLAPRGRQFTKQKARTVKRIDRWRVSDIRRDQCITGSSLLAREQAAPGSAWPPRPRARWRQPSRLRPLTRQFVDLVQEQQEAGAAALIIAHAELGDLAGYKNWVRDDGRVFASSAVQRAVAEALSLGLVEQLPHFDEQDPQLPPPRPMERATKAGHALREGKPAYRLGPVARIELQRAVERATRPVGYAERQLSAEARKLAARAGNRRFSPQYFGRSDQSNALPEEAPEQAQTALPSANESPEAPGGAESVSPSAPCPSPAPAAATSELSRCRRRGPTPDAPPLELRNSWTRESAWRPTPRRAEPGGAQRPAAASETQLARNRPPSGETFDVGDGSETPDVRDLLAACLRQLAPA